MTEAPLSGTTIGFIGLGLMGQPMATNVHKAGAKLRVPKRAREAVADLDSATVALFDTPAEITQGSDLVILMLPNARVVESVCTGDDGVFAGATKKTLIMDMGTTDLPITNALARQAQACGATYVDAPVTGGRVGASTGGLTIFVGADGEATFERVQPVLEVLGKNITHMGAIGSGQAAKVVNQLMNFSIQASVAEGIALARRMDLDLNTLIPALAGGAADSVVLQILGPRMAAEDWSVTAHMDLAVKDMDIVLNAAEQNALQLKVAQLVRAQWANAAEHIGGAHDIDELVRFVDPTFTGGGWHGPQGAIGSGTKPD